MTENISRALLALAALDLTTQELRRLLLDLSAMPPDELAARISALQESASRHCPSSTEPSVRNTPHFDLDVGLRVERLLKGEARLNTTQAVEMLTNKIVKLDLLPPDEIPQLSRKSLQDWIIRLSQRIPSKEILRLATVIRNEKVHSPPQDWTLKE